MESRKSSRISANSLLRLHISNKEHKFLDIGHFGWHFSSFWQISIFDYLVVWLENRQAPGAVEVQGLPHDPEQKRNDKRRVEPVFWEFIHVTGSTKSTVIDFHTILVCEVLVNTENVFHFTQSVTQSRAFASKTQVPYVAYRFVCALEQPLHLNTPGACQLSSQTTK